MEDEAIPGRESDPGRVAEPHLRPNLHLPSQRSTTSLIQAALAKAMPTVMFGRQETNENTHAMKNQDIAVPLLLSTILQPVVIPTATSPNGHPNQTELSDTFRSTKDRLSIQGMPVTADPMNNHINQFRANTSGIIRRARTRASRLLPDPSIPDICL